MGYSRNPITLKKMLPELEPLKRGEAATFKPIDHEGRPISVGMKAYKIREALYIASLHPEDYPELARARTLYEVIADAANNQVLAVILGSPVRAAYDGPGGPVPTQALGPRNLARVTSVEQVIQFWMDSQPTNDPIHIAKAELSNAELAQLAKWAGTLKPAWMLLQVRGTTAITIAPDSSDVPEEAKIK